MMRNEGGEKGRREERKRKFSQCQMEEQLAPLSLLWGWIFLYHTNTHTYSHTNTHAELPPVTPHHLPSTWSSKRDQAELSSLVERERIRAMEKGVEGLWCHMLSPFVVAALYWCLILPFINHQFTRISFLSCPATLHFSLLFVCVHLWADMCMCGTPSPSRQARPVAPAMN